MLTVMTFNEAGKLLIEYNLGSVQLLCRKGNISFSEALILVNQLEDKKVIGPFDCEKSRVILMNIQQFNELCRNMSETTLERTI